MRRYPQSLAIFAFATALSIAPLALGQGSLTPPGAPAATMRTLTQVEPRIPIDTLPSAGTGLYGITAPGSYYLTGNISRGASACVIEISASDVTIDLNGFGIVESTGPSPIIRINRPAAQMQNITIKNGYIEAPGPTVVALTGNNQFVNNLVLSDLKVRSTDGIGTLANLTAVLAPRIERVQVANFNGPTQLISQGSELSGIIIDCTYQKSSPSTNPFSGSVVAFSADTVQNCVVSGVQCSGNAVGVSANLVRGCTVVGVNSSAGTSIGITGLNVADCSVRTVGTIASGTATVGINGNVVRACSVSFLGIAGTTGTVNGIGPSSLVEDCFVTSVNGAGALTGISGSLTARCSVNTITQASSTFACTAISGRVTTDCFIFGVSGNTSALATGILSGTVTSCRVGTVTNSGSGEGNGITFVVAAAPTEPNKVSHCTVNNTKNHGISAQAAGLVLNCNVANAGAGAGVTDGAGIFISSPDVRVDTCTVNTSDQGVRVAAVAGTDFSSVLIVRNSVSGCPIGFTVQPNNRVGPVVTGAGGIIASTNPWANFTDL